MVFLRQKFKYHKRKKCQSQTRKVNLTLHHTKHSKTYQLPKKYNHLNSKTILLLKQDLLSICSLQVSNTMHNKLKKKWKNLLKQVKRKIVQVFMSKTNNLLFNKIIKLKTKRNINILTLILSLSLRMKKIQKHR